MAKQRDYRAEREARDAKARSEGFRSYAAKRHAQSKGRTTPPKQAPARPRKQRDYAAEYRARQAKAKREGFSGYAEKRRIRARLKEAIDKIRAAFGDRPKYNETRTRARHEELDDDELDELLELEPDEMQRIMAVGHPADHQPNLYYH